MQGRDVQFQGRYDLFTIYLISGMTIFLASFNGWAGTNLSVLGNRTDNRLLFAMWGFAIGIHYCVYVHYLFHVGRYRNPGDRTLIYTTAAFLLMAVMIPYMPGEYPLKTDLHVLLASFSPVLLAFNIIDFLRFLSSCDRMHFHRTWGILWMMAACSALFPLEVGFITSFLGMFIITRLYGCLRYMEQLLAAQK